MYTLVQTKRSYLLRSGCGLWRGKIWVKFVQGAWGFHGLEKGISCGKESIQKRGRNRTVPGFCVHWVRGVEDWCWRAGATSLGRGRKTQLWKNLKGRPGGWTFHFEVTVMVSLAALDLIKLGGALDGLTVQLGWRAGWPEGMKLSRNWLQDSESAGRKQQLGC